jgi:hypothetical protein
VDKVLPIALGSGQKKSLAKPLARLFNPNPNENNCTKSDTNTFSLFNLLPNIFEPPFEIPPRQQQECELFGRIHKIAWLPRIMDQEISAQICELSLIAVCVALRIRPALFGSTIDTGSIHNVSSSKSPKLLFSGLVE